MSNKYFVGINYLRKGFFVAVGGEGVYFGLNLLKNLEIFERVS